MAILNKEYTEARIALGRSGHSVNLNEALDFKLAHAFARDAVYSSLDVGSLRSEIELLGLEAIDLQSAALDRETYLKRPDYGRKLSNKSIEELESYPRNYDVLISVADGLSAPAVQQHFVPVLKLIADLYKQAKLTIAPVCIVEQGRVAIGDPIGELLGAQLSIMFIGERPGLSSPNSMGCYLTYQPKTGLTDESRNCISNIRDRGLSYVEAANKLYYLSVQSLTKKLSGTNLKDEQIELL
ncbi:ethanolamine ammonia-lyase subunit EutC [Pedobacter sp. PWIIR3]